jgi:hypothetical protein
MENTNNISAPHRQVPYFQNLRFAKGDGSKGDCPNLHDYCGGNYQGIINNLDYIKSIYHSR